MLARYADLVNSKGASRDFVIRRRYPAIYHLAAVFFSIMLAVTSLSTSVEDRVTMVVSVAAILLIAGWYVISVIQKNRDLVLATEFQNALFASALGISNKFCVIIRKDGTIIYLDRSFQEIFPDFLKQPRRTIDALFDIGKVSKEEANKVFSAIEQGVYSKVVFDIRGVGNEYHKVIMSIEPILRPSGYVILRGRDFIESRSNQDVQANMMTINKSSITLFSHVMDAMEMGVYMVNPSGDMVYVNPTLEKWLGYQDGEIARNNMSLQDIILHHVTRSDRIQPENYEGEISLQKKTGGMMKAFINQKIIRDETGRMLGCTALVHQYSESAPGVKNKLW
jgi:PAS domain S-box-containing protein